MPTTSRSGRIIHFERHGDGPPLVLLHGLFQVAATWERLGYLKALTSSFDVISIDSLGHGSSDHPNDLDAYRAERRAADVVAVLDELGIERAIVWGYSMGAWQAFSCVRHAPDRVRGVVAGGWCPVRGQATATDAYVAHLGFDPATDWFAALLAVSTDDAIIGPLIEAGDTEAFGRAFRACELEGGGFVEDLAAFDGPRILYCGTADPYHDTTAAVAVETASTFVSLAEADHGQAFVISRPALDAIGPLLERLGGI